MSCSRTQHGGGRSRTPDLSLRSPTLYHWATALPRDLVGYHRIQDLAENLFPHDMFFCTVTTFCLIRNKHIQQNNASLLNAHIHTRAASQEILYSGFPTRFDTDCAVQPQKMPRGLNFGFRNKRDWAIYVAKTRALISCAITAHLICTYVYTFESNQLGKPSF